MLTYAKVPRFNYDEGGLSSASMIARIVALAITSRSFPTYSSVFPIASNDFRQTS